MVYFDGVCGLCNRFVDFVLRRDRRGVFRFAPLQGGTASERLSQGRRPGNPELRTLLVEDKDGVHEKSEAVLRVLAELGGAWRLFGIAKRVPRALRDGLYDLLARNRYRLFGKRETCRLPTAGERARFLP